MIIIINDYYNNNNEWKKKFATSHFVPSAQLRRKAGYNIKPIKHVYITWSSEAVKVFVTFFNKS